MTKTLVSNIKGPKGDPGDAGPQGPKGDTGNPGSQGTPGQYGASQTLTANGAAIPAATTYLNGPNITVSLPDATVNAGSILTIKLVYAFTSATIVPIDGQTIDGYTSYQLGKQWQWVTFQSANGEWNIIGAKPGGLLSILTPIPSDGLTGVPYSYQLVGVGGWPGYTWSVKSGILPDGLTLSESGFISGTPTLATVGNFTVQLQDSIGTVTTANVTITVTGGFIFVQRGTLVNAQSGSTVTPTLPSSTKKGNLLVAHVGCSGNTITSSNNAWVVVGTGSEAIVYKENCDDTETIPTFDATGQGDIWAYVEEWSGGEATSSLDQQNQSSSGGSSNWTAVLPSLSTVPGELAVSAAYWNGSNTGGNVSLAEFTDNTGAAVAGTLVTGANQWGQYFAGVSGITGPTGSDYVTVGMGLSVFAGGNGILVTFKPAAQGSPGSPAILTSSLANASTGLPYSATLKAEAGVPPYTWSLDSSSPDIPAGMSLSSSGVLSGSPTTAATTALVFKVTDSASDSGTSTITFTVDQTPTVTFNTTAPSEPASRSQGYTVAGITGVTQPVSVNNNVWSPVTGWASHLYVVDPTDFWVIANFPEGSTQVSAFPSNDCRFGELPLSGFTQITSSFSEKMNANPGTQAWAAYDVWLNNWADEIMIHHDLARFNPYDAPPLARGVSFGGSHGVPTLAWDLYHYGSSEYVWQPANNAFNVEAGSVDILAMLQWMVANSYLPASNTLTAIGYGWELCSTGGVDEFFRVDSFSLTATYT